MREPNMTNIGKDRLRKDNGSQFATIPFHSYSGIPNAKSASVNLATK